MVDIAAFRPRRRAAHAAELAVDRHEIDQGGADAELVEADGFLFLLPAGAQYVDVEAGHAVQIDDAQNDMVYGLDRDHACSNALRSEEHTSELQSLMRISYAVFCLKK